MQGKIILANRLRARYAVVTDNGCTLFELMGSAELGVGDVISGKLESLGPETIRRGTDEISILVQNVDCGLGSALRWVRALE